MKNKQNKTENWNTIDSTIRIKKLAATATTTRKNTKRMTWNESVRKEQRYSIAQQDDNNRWLSSQKKEKTDKSDDWLWSRWFQEKAKPKQKPKKRQKNVQQQQQTLNNSACDFRYSSCIRCDSCCNFCSFNFFSTIDKQQKWKQYCENQKKRCRLTNL